MPAANLRTAPSCATSTLVALPPSTITRVTSAGPARRHWPVHIGIGVGAETDWRLPSRIRWLDRAAPPAVSIMIPFWSAKVGMLTERAASRKAMVLGLASAGIWTATRPPVPRRLGSAFPANPRSRDNLEHVLIRPRVIAGLGGEMVPVALVTARPHHHVDARSPAKHFAHGPKQRSPVQIRIRPGLERQSRSLPRFSVQRAGSSTSGTASVPPASSSSTLTVGFSARRRATTELDEPDPQTMKS